jgi:hypothetical protein
MAPKRFLAWVAVTCTAGLQVGLVAILAKERQAVFEKDNKKWLKASWHINSLLFNL